MVITVLRAKDHVQASAGQIDVDKTIQSACMVVKMVISLNTVLLTVAEQVTVPLISAISLMVLVTRDVKMATTDNFVRTFVLAIANMVYVTKAPENVRMVA